MSTPRRLRGVTALAAAGLATAVLALPAAGESHTSITPDCAEDAASLEFARTLLEGQGVPPEVIDEAMAFACSGGGMASGDDDSLLTETISLNFITEMLEAQGLPPDQVEQMLVMVEQLAHMGGGGGAGKVNTPREDEVALTENVTPNFIEEILTAQGMAPEAVGQIVAVYEQMGLVGEDGELMTEGLPLDFLEQMLAGETPQDASGGLTLEAILGGDEEQAMIGEVAKPGAHAEPTADDPALVDPAGTVEAAVAAAAAQRGIDPATLQQMTLEDILGLLAEEQNGG